VTTSPSSQTWSTTPVQARTHLRVVQHSTQRAQGGYVGHPIATSSPSATTTPGGSRPGQLTRRGRRLVATLGLIPFVCAFVLLGVHKASAADVAPQMTTVLVQPGQTLWDIAQAIDPTTDPRKTIFTIEQINGLSEASLRVGQELIVPVS